jgi:ABC-2 type transport system permease protein
MFKWPWVLGTLDWNPVFSGYLGLVLYSAAAVAIGLLVTSLTDSQAIAFVVTVFLLAVLWFLGSVASIMEGTVGNALRYLSFQTHLEGFARGLIDTRDVVYFISVAALALVLAFRVLERRKWA